MIRSNTLYFLAAWILLFSADPAQAATNCSFTTSGKVMTLAASCSTDQTILIPNGFTLNGAGYKITAVDPAGGSFQGPILRNAGPAANVSNLFLRTNVADVCNDEPNKVVGILLDSCAAKISGVNILINKGAGASTCEEGVAVQAQQLPFNPRSSYRLITVQDSTLNYNQRTAVRGLGNVQITATGNLIKNDTNPAVATRGIEIAEGAKGILKLNEILRHSHAPDLSNPSYGILLWKAAASTVTQNTLNFNDVAIRISGTTKSAISYNTIRSSQLDGILVDDEAGTPTTALTITYNNSQENTLNGINLQNINNLVKLNTLKSNTASKNLQMGIVLEGSSNTVQGNTAAQNTVKDIADFGTGNSYKANACATSTGAPVDCPAVPPAPPEVVLGGCKFTPGNKTLTLLASCTTDQTIFVPDGFSVIGGLFTITAVDPQGGVFQGPVLQNAGKLANISNLFVRTNLSDVCNDEPQKVVGIMLDNAAGTLANVNVLVNKGSGASTCTEGVGVQAQALPHDPAKPLYKVTVKGSTLNYNQRAGIVLKGNVNARVEANLIKGLTNPSLPTAGLEVTDGAKVYALTNEIVRFSHAPSLTPPAYGILLQGAGASTLEGNTLNFNDIGVRVNGGTKIVVTKNVLRSSTLDGILVDDELNIPATAVSVTLNDSQKNLLNGINFQQYNGKLTKNLVKGNTVSRNNVNGINMEGSVNKVQQNIGSLNDVLDIADFGSGNLYTQNTCTTSSGAPVDCPHLP